LYRRLGGPQGRSRRVRKISPPPGFDPRPSVAIPTELPCPMWCIMFHHNVLTLRWSQSGDSAIGLWGLTGPHRPMALFCYCAQYTFLVYRLESVQFFVHYKHFRCTVRNVFSFCAQYAFLGHRVDSGLCVFPVHISILWSVKCSVSVHRTQI
jgi:hypothetical protein